MRRKKKKRARISNDLVKRFALDYRRKKLFRFKRILAKATITYIISNSFS